MSAPKGIPAKNILEAIDSSYALPLPIAADATIRIAYNLSRAIISFGTVVEKARLSNDEISALLSVFAASIEDFPADDRSFSAYR